MSFAISWYVEKQIIYLKFSGIVTSEEIIQANNETVAFALAGMQPVHIIFDALDVTEFPNNLRWLIQVMQRNKTFPKGWNIIVADNPIIQFLISAILQLVKVRIRTCTRLEDAYSFLSQPEALRTLAS